VEQRSNAASQEPEEGTELQPPRSPQQPTEPHKGVPHFSRPLREVGFTNANPVGFLTSAQIDHQSLRRAPSHHVVIPNRAPSPVRNLLSSA